MDPDLLTNAIVVDDVRIIGYLQQRKLEDRRLKRM